MKSIVLVLLVFLGAGAAASAWAQDPTTAEFAHAKAVFNLWCYSCHKRLKPGDIPVAGTSSLQRKYQGSEPAALEDRTDLSAAYIKNMVRHGFKSMPATRKTEISDADLDALAAYLTRKH